MMLLIRTSTCALTLLAISAIGIYMLPSMVSHAQTLPPVATTPEIFCIGRLELNELEPEALRAFARTCAQPQWSNVSPMLRKYELLRTKLLGFGVRTVTLAASEFHLANGSNSEILLFSLHSDNRANRRELIDFWMDNRTAESLTAKQLSEWVAVYHKTRNCLPSRLIIT